jgi:DNA-binding PadR family transcriptional regulator
MSYAYEARVPWALPWDTDAPRRPRGRRGQRAMMADDQIPAAGFPEPDADAAEGGERRRGGHKHRGGPGGRHGGPGRGPGFGPGFGPGPWGGKGPWGPPPGRRRDRGDVRAAILLLLDEKPRHGYEILTELADRSDGQWRPSPGSVYPVLKRLSREGLVEPSHEEGRRVFSLTDEGRALVAAERESWGEPWAQHSSPAADAAMDLWSEGRQLGAAVWQVSQLNDPAQVEAATQALIEARKTIYRLLAE